MTQRCPSDVRTSFSSSIDVEKNYLNRDNVGAEPRWMVERVVNDQRRLFYGHRREGGTLKNLRRLNYITVYFWYTYFNLHIVIYNIINILFIIEISTLQEWLKWNASQFVVDWLRLRGVTVIVLYLYVHYQRLDIRLSSTLK